MALVGANTAPLDPETKLAQALADYEKILSDEDRNQLHNQGLPDTAAAINFTTLIDRDCSRNRRQCMGPRLITFLESIQQFSKVVDTFVSSHPEFAALVWGGVKLTLLAANNFSSYFDQLSTLLMTLGRQCPQIQELSFLYPSTRLRKALCDYYAAIIQLYKHSTQFLRESAYRKLPKMLLSSFKTEFGPHEREIAALGQEVRDEASLASKQAKKQENELQARERLEADGHRKNIAKWMDNFYRDNKKVNDSRLEIHRRRLEKRKRQVLKSLSTYNYQRTYKQIRKECVPGTSNWVLEDLAFKTWKEEDPKVLWCSGKLGSGKSIISACVTASIMESVSPKNVTSFFFCRFDDQESLKATTIIGTIARQFVNDLPADAFREFDLENADGTAIIKFLEASLNNAHQYFIVLDGLDECSEAQIKEVAEALYSLLSSPLLHIKLFWSSRPNVPSWLALQFRPQQHVSLDTAESQSRIAVDIRQFVNTTLGEWLEGDSPELQISDPTLILSITDHLEKEAHGMFLWVKLQLQTLREKNSDSQILAALRHLPRDLPETYERILSKFTPADDIEVGNQIFRWAAVAKRPLTIEELREAIEIEPLQDTWNASCFVNDMKKAVACCGNLVFVDEEHETIHFTHGSVKQYLCSGATVKSRSHDINLEKADADAGAICVTYLSFPVFNTQVARTPGMDIKATGIPSMVVKNSLPTGRSANQIALTLLRRRNKSDQPVKRLLEEAIGDTEASRQYNVLRQYSFLSYSRQFWLEHTKQRIMPGSEKLWRLWCKLIKDIDRQDSLINIPWTSEDLEKRSITILKWIVDFNHCSLAQLIIGSSRRLSEENLQTLVGGAAANGYLQLLEACLDSKDISQVMLDFALQAAAEQGHLAVVERLLQEKVHVNASYGSITPLRSAAKEGHLAVMERLLQEKADVNAVSATFDGCGTALQMAAKEGHLAVVERLLQEKVDVNAVPYPQGGRTALQLAAQGGHLAVVERLLQEKADVNAVSARFDCCGTALQLAAEEGHLAVVERLLQEKIDVNAVSTRFLGGGTALQRAAREGHLAVVKRLKAAGAK
ncbi:MAG: hypothetical protein Q9191_001175 [Dirinaria sp. TL-2023a]